MYHIARKASLSWIVAFGIVCGFILQFFVAVDLACASSHTAGLVNHQLEQEGCFIILAGKDRTTDGSVLVAHNEDGKDKSTRLIYVPRQHHSEKEVYLNYVTIPQVPVTLAYWAMGNSEAVAMEPEYDNEWILNGMNEAGVCVTCAVTSTRETAPPAKQGLTRFALRQLILERATSARAAVDLFSHLISEYGLALSPGIPDQTIACGLADSKEAWLIESSFRHWVAKRVPDDSCSASANIYTIDTEWDLASPDLVNYAIQQGWHDPAQGPFSFKDAYTPPQKLNSVYSTSRVWQAQVMLDDPEPRQVDVSFLWSIISQPPVQCYTTQAFMIWHLRDGLPKELGTLMWHGLGNATTSVMVPIYMGSTEVPAPYMDSPGDYDTSSAYWQFRKIGTTLYPQRWIYAAPYKKVRRKLNRHQLGIKFRNMWVEWLAPIYYKFYGVEALKNVLTDYTYYELQFALNTAVEIVETLQFEPSASQASGEEESF